MENDIRHWIRLVESETDRTDDQAADLPDGELDESAPPGKEAETWIKHRKAEFKDRYGKRWKRVLYAKAWKLFGD